MDSLDLVVTPVQAVSVVQVDSVVTPELVAFQVQVDLVVTPVQADSVVTLV